MDDNNTLHKLMRVDQVDRSLLTNSNRHIRENFFFYQRLIKAREGRIVAVQ
ncbi:hypothetical protein L917_08842 [Phytophthora nicotianae]|uniref:Uncharacterized protein n=1 Tax=Phytophthora nicotianae TaxID=4792 RepID=W2L661_PHYNI|nr:hypothetical protein L917_08842 [Phytophthora nicotianae]